MNEGPAWVDFISCLSSNSTIWSSGVLNYFDDKKLENVLSTPFYEKIYIPVESSCKSLKIIFWRILMSKNVKYKKSKNPLTVWAKKLHWNSFIALSTSQLKVWKQARVWLWWTVYKAPLAVPLLPTPLGSGKVSYNSGRSRSLRPLS
jgi:hypothetical protein